MQQEDAAKMHISEETKITTQLNGLYRQKKVLSVPSVSMTTVAKHVLSKTWCRTTEVQSV